MMMGEWVTSECSDKGITSKTESSSVIASSEAAIK